MACRRSETRPSPSVQRMRTDGVLRDGISDSSGRRRASGVGFTRRKRGRSGLDRPWQILFRVPTGLVERLVCQQAIAFIPGWALSLSATGVGGGS